MDFLNLAKERYSVRKFTAEPIAQDALGRILEAGYVAPTACNMQPQRITVIRSEDALAKLRKCTKCHFGATCALLVCYDRAGSWKRPYDGRSSGEVDASIVTTHMMLEAASLGVGTTWVMYFDPEAVRCEFNIPDTLDITALLVMGYPAEDAAPYPGHSEFRPFEETVEYR